MGIPLPALALRSPEDIDPLALSQRSQQVRNLMGVNALQPGELQQGQMDLQDRQAATTAFREWDGKDPADLLHAVVKNDGSANAAYAMQSHIQAVRQQASEIA